MVVGERLMDCVVRLSRWFVTSNAPQMAAWAQALRTASLAAISDIPSAGIQTTNLNLL